MNDTSEKENQAGDGGKNTAMVVYVLQAVAFVIGITAVIGVVVNYVKMEDVRGTWVESHFRWQIRTFWFSLLWFVVGTILVWILIGWAILFANAVWVIYRIVKGWLNLSENRPI